MFAVFSIPEFPLQAVLRHWPEWRELPVALVEQRTASKAVVLYETAPARIAGVREGLTSTQAMARCPEIRIVLRSAEWEVGAQEVLLQFAYGFSPFMEATAPGVCTVDLRDQPARCTERLVEQLAGLNFQAQIGVGRTPDLALLAAQHARPFLRVENSESFLKVLPVEALGPSPALLGILKKWGIRTVEGFKKLGKRQVTERLGAEAMVLFDRAMARNDRPLKLITPPERYEERIEFDQEVEVLDPLLFMLRRFLEQIVRRLELVWKVVAELHLELTFSAGEKYRRIFRIPAPTGDVDVLFRMLHTHLENFHAEHPVTALRLEAVPVVPESGQAGLFETGLRDLNRFHETLARLTALLGPDRVGRPVVEDTHRPDTFRMESEAFRFESAVAEKLPLPPLLPLRRFRPPYPVRVRMQNGIPVLANGAGITGPLRAARGPWRSSGDWWDRQSWGRQEWDVELADGSLCRLYEEGQRWFAEGIYD